MKVKTIDHICIAVRDMAQAEEHFIKCLGAEKIMTIRREDAGYRGTYLRWGDTVVTLAAPISENSHIARFLERKGEGLNHMGIEVEDVFAAEVEFAGKGGIVGPREIVPKVRREFAPSPKSLSGVVCQVIEYEEPYKSAKDPAAHYEQLAKDGLLYS